MLFVLAVERIEIGFKAVFIQKPSKTPLAGAPRIGIANVTDSPFWFLVNRYLCRIQRCTTTAVRRLSLFAQSGTVQIT